MRSAPAFEPWESRQRFSSHDKSRHLTTPSAQTAKPPSSTELKTGAMSASVWVAGGVVAKHGIRLATNLVLTRLLFPDAFGLMAIVHAVNQGLEMLSDVGIRASVIQHDRDDEDFLDTAWTIQVVRGFVLWLCAALLAYPVSRIYEQPLLALLIPVASSSAVIRGLASTSLMTLNRRLELRKLVPLEVLTQLVGAVFMFGLAWYWRSVWPLALGGVVSNVVRTGLSYRVGDRRRPRLHWERETLHDMTGFGKWIFLSSFMSYLLGQGDRLIMGGFMSMGELGVYSIAALVARQAETVNKQVDNNVIFPVFSRTGKITTPGLLEQVARYRLVRMGIFLPGLWILIVFGDDLIRLLWDERYWDAGWMVQALSGGTLFLIIGAVGPLHLARGESWIGVLVICVRAAVLVPGMVLGGYLAGAEGLIIAISASYVVYYPMQVWISIRYGVWLPLYDAVGFALSGAVIWAGLTFA